MPQALIRQIRRSDNAGSDVQTDHHVLSEAIMTLIADPNPVDPATCPETLLLDIPRIAAMKAEYTRILDMLVIINTAAHACDMEGLDEADQAALLTRVAALLVGLGSTGPQQLPSDSPASRAFLETFLENSLSSTGRAVFLYQIIDSRRPNHTIRLDVTRRLPAALLSSMPLAHPHDVLRAATPIMPLINKVVSEFEVFCAVHHFLHCDTYMLVLRNSAGDSHAISQC